MRVSKHKRIGLTLLLMTFALPVASGGHSVSQIFVDGVLSSNKLTMTYFVGIQDIAYAVDQESDLGDTMAGARVREGIEVTRKHLQDGMQVILEDGSGVGGLFVRADVPTVGEGVNALRDFRGEKFAYTFDYTFARPPESIDFLQTYQSTNSVIPVNVTLTLEMQHKANPAVVAFPIGDRMTEPASIALDWSDEADEPIEVTTIVTEPINAYLYIHHHEVRLEMVMSLGTMETWIPVPRANDAFVDVSEQEMMKDSLEGFFSFHNPLKVNGSPVRFDVLRMGFFESDAADFLTQVEARRIETEKAYLGVVLISKVDDLPDHVELTWTMFNDQVDLVRGVVFTREQGDLFTCTPDASQYEWMDPGNLALPQVEGIQVADVKLGTAEQTALIASLLNNVYQSFAYHDESDVYDALDQSVYGALLAELYLKIKRSLIMQSQGGAVARVQKMMVTDVAPSGKQIEDGFSRSVTWQVDGTIEHWGHLHTRVNEYTAELGVIRVGNIWKIRDMKVLRQKQVKVRTSLRML